MKLQKIMPILAVLLCAAMIAVGCGKKSSDEQTQAFSGTLSEFFNNVILVQNGSDTEEFHISEKTEYVYDTSDYISPGDEVEITFHDDGGGHEADKVMVTNHVEETGKFTGMLIEHDSKHLTVTENDLTVVFEHDKDTVFPSDALVNGDLVEIEYYGDISEDPYAVSLTIVQSDSEQNRFYAYGIISES